ncbi:MAG TPA: M20/M25/M40 family metallo-hydrolase [Candidatus Bacteroides avicola]|uniref:M20/M25/M40 family metallo-hydrolase n=1 Tax=Candidatus Bacteroides avicola TaxID=2838468 RepID=A0A9D2HZP8_9BACE|nr:M20/M25/M40 family metallo-hydrolase [Candidatus Bacteroides avicola]
MRKVLLGIACILGTSVGTFAQSPKEKGLQSINQDKAEAIVEFLADDELLGREAGQPGSRIVARYLASELKEAGIAPLPGTTAYYQPFEACAVERQQKGRWQVHPDSLARLKQGTHRSLKLNNILGWIPGERTDEYVIIGAHFDHIGYDPTLAGDQIYNGADDNASGVSAALQIARAFAASGKKPLRNVIFAFWDGEEKGLLGSKYFVQTCPFVKQIKGYLNFDMIGRNNKPDRPRHVVYFYTESHPAFGQWLKDDIKEYGLKLEPDYRAWDRPIGGSDNGSFALQEIPIIWYHTDGHPDYHQPGDHAERINWEKLTDITRAAFLNMWNLANEKTY